MKVAPANSGRFATLDGLRGIAAICVMLHHAGPNSPITVPWGYLAVDLFFCLSGFVISLSYEDRVRQGMTLREIIRRRLTRLYPMALVAALLGIILWGGNASMILLLPSVFSGGALYPTNPPMWSLLFELLANVTFAAFIFSSSTKRLVTVMAISGTLLASAILSVGTARLMGAEWSSFLLGFARTGFSFGTGVLLFRMWRASGAPRKTTQLAWVLLLALPILLIVPDIDPIDADLIGIFLVLPVLIWFGASWEIPTPRPARWLGDLSYPLYCINLPILAYLEGGAGERALLCVALVAAALALDRLVDRPGQRLIKRLLQSSQARATALPSSS